MLCVILYILAQVKFFRVTWSGPGTVIVKWRDIGVDSKAIMYVVYYYEASEMEQHNVTVPSSLLTLTLMNLKEGALYRFSMAVMKQEGTEVYVGEKTAVVSLMIQPGAKNELPDFDSKGNSFLR